MRVPVPIPDTSWSDRLTDAMRLEIDNKVASPIMFRFGPRLFLRGAEEAVTMLDGYKTLLQLSARDWQRFRSAILNAAKRKPVSR